MGLGKTFVGSERLWENHTPYNLLICQKSKIADWYKHFREYYTDDYTPIIYKGQSIDQIPPKSVLIVNYQLAWRRPQLNKLRDFTLMLDESSNIKNDKSKQSKFILGLRPANVILLSGTPISGKYEELWSQCKLLGWNITKTAFLKRYTIQHWNPILSFYEIKGYQNIEELKTKLRSYGAVFMKTSEVFDLPKQNFVDVDCKTTPDYVTFNRDHYLVRDGKELIGDTATTARLILRQLAGVWNANKLARVTELIESTNDRIIIFYNFNLELEALRAIAHKLKRPISLVNGATKDLSAFENADNSVTLIQYQAGAMGLNLQKANTMIYFTPPQSAELWMQSQKRIHRMGQKRACFYYRMITKNSIDGHIYAALERGENYTDELFKKELFKDGK